jgi:heterotetrameric sarcosine oxidase gamma subunit
MPELARTPSRPGEPQVIQMSAVACKAVLSLKSWSLQDKAARSVVLAGQELPRQVGLTLSGPIRALCLSPGEWLILSQQYTAAELQAIDLKLPEQDLALVDLTDGFAGLAIQGSAARELLSQGCGLDFHSDNFPADFCVRTRLAQISVVIQALDDPARFELYCGRSYFHYLRSWLTDAAAVTDPGAPGARPSR